MTLFILKHNFFGLLQLFIYLFAPLCHQIKESDLQTFRLENGLKLWQAMWDYRHPDSLCFTAHCKPKPRAIWNKLLKEANTQFGDVFLGSMKFYFWLDCKLSF